MPRPLNFHELDVLKRSSRPLTKAQTDDLFASVDWLTKQLYQGAVTILQLLTAMETQGLVTSEQATEIRGLVSSFQEHNELFR